MRGLEGRLESYRVGVGWRRRGAYEQVGVDIAAQPAGEAAPWSILVKRRGEGRGIDGIHFIQMEYKYHERASVVSCGLESASVGSSLASRKGSHPWSEFLGRDVAAAMLER